MTTAVLADTSSELALSNCQALFWRFEDVEGERRKSRLEKEWGKYSDGVKARLLGCIKAIDEEWPNYMVLSPFRVKWIESFVVRGQKIYECKEHGNHRLAFFIRGSRLFFFYSCKKPGNKWDSGDITRANNCAIELMDYLDRNGVKIEI
jgi:hypothetical protein